MNAIRRDELLDNLHSAYVDQWDWEKVITKKERTDETLEATVREIFKIIKHMEHEVWYKYPQAVCHLADDVFFITSQELEDRYPDLSVKDRETAITREKGCVFIKQILYGTVGPLADLRKFIAPGTGGLLKAFFESFAHIFHLVRITAGQCLCKIKDALGGLFYAPVSVFCDVCLGLCLGSGIYFNAFKHLLQIRAVCNVEGHPLFGEQLVHDVLQLLGPRFGICL